MADTDIIVSEMTPASQINTTDLMIMTQPDSQAETGYSTKSGTVLQVANKMLKGTEYSTDLPDFADKTPLGGLEELKADIKALLPVSSASGNPCTFDTDIAVPLKSLIANIVANQDLHGYDHPWAGGGGKNKLPFFNNSKTFYGMDVVPQSNGRWNFSGTAEISTAIQYTATVDLTGVYRFIADGYTAQGSSNITLYCQPKGGGALFAVYATQTIDFSQNDLVSIAFYASSGQTFNYQNIGLMLVLDSEPDKTFAPYENICPIVGHSELNLVRCGVNIWDEDWEVGSIDNTNGDNSNAGTNRIRSKNYIKVVPSSNIYFVNDSGIQAFAYYYRADKSYISFSGMDISNTVISIPNDCAFMRFRTNDNAVPYGNTISINYPSTDTSYHAYNGQTFTVSFGQTVCGGVYDANAGKVRVTYARSNLYDKTWTDYTAITNPNGSLFTAPLSDVSFKAWSFGGLTTANSNALAPNSTGDFPDAPVDTFWWNNASNGLRCCYGLPNQQTSLADFVQFLIDKQVYVVGELATPIEIDVSALSVAAIVGTNNITSNGGGDVTVSYKDSIQHYIDNQ